MNMQMRMYLRTKLIHINIHAYTYVYVKTYKMQKGTEKLVPARDTPTHTHAETPAHTDVDTHPPPHTHSNTHTHTHTETDRHSHTDPHNHTDTHTHNDVLDWYLKIIHTHSDMARECFEGYMHAGPTALMRVCLKDGREIVGRLYAMDGMGNIAMCNNTETFYSIYDELRVRHPPILCMNKDAIDKCFMLCDVLEDIAAIISTNYSDEY